MAEPTAHRLVGKNYLTPDLVAKVTGKAKYAEDYKAEGMLWAKLLLSPMPHARVMRIDTTKALAMPGVKAILTVDDLPGVVAGANLGEGIIASTFSERGLTNEPLYEGEPILAVAAVDELTATNAIEAIEIEYEQLPFVVDPIESLRPGGPNPRTEGNAWVRPVVASGPPANPEPKEWKWSEEDFANAPAGQLPTGRSTDEWKYGDLEKGFAEAALVLDVQKFFRETQVPELAVAEKKVADFKKASHQRQQLRACRAGSRPLCGSLAVGGRLAGVGRPVAAGSIRGRPPNPAHLSGSSRSRWYVPAQSAFA